MISTSTNAINISAGFSLLEVVLSIAIVSIAIGFLVTLSGTVIHGSDNARSRTIADQYVRDGLEQVRSYRDHNGWAALTVSPIVASTTNTSYTLDLSGALTKQTSVFDPTTSSTWGAYLISGTAFYRSVQLVADTTPSPTQLTVTVSVYTQCTTKCLLTDSAQTLLTNWQ
jgi:prepilin-type N-terminal cleavage/methylation domain-containing protein